jgi:hypothetical protein
MLLLILLYALYVLMKKMVKKIIHHLQRNQSRKEIKWICRCISDFSVSFYFYKAVIWSRFTSWVCGFICIDMFFVCVRYIFLLYFIFSWSLYSCAASKNVLFYPMCNLFLFFTFGKIEYLKNFISVLFDPKSMSKISSWHHSFSYTRLEKQMKSNINRKKKLFTIIYEICYL